MRKNHAISRKTEKNMKKSRNLTHFLKNPLFLVQRCPKSGFFGRKIAFSSQIYIKNLQNAQKICKICIKYATNMQNCIKYAKMCKNMQNLQKMLQNVQKICKICIKYSKSSKNQVFRPKILKNCIFRSNL